MGKGKNYCSKCEKRHFPPTGKKCTEGQDSAGMSVVKDKNASKSKDI